MKELDEITIGAMITAENFKKCIQNHNELLAKI